jgi:hypothetical protein
MTPITFHNPEGLLPPHRVTRPEHVDELFVDMLRRGWHGVPLIGYLSGPGQIQQLSGTHRHAACLRIGIRVPVKVYPAGLIARCWGRLNRWIVIMQGRL